MTIDDFKKKLTEATSSPEKMPAALADLIKEVEVDYNDRDNLMTRVTDLEKKNSELHDTNMRLYLAQVGSSDANGEEEEQDDEELTGMDAVDSFFNKLTKGEE